MNSPPAIQKYMLDHGIIIFLPAMSLNNGNNRDTTAIASINENNTTTYDSAMNCLISCQRREPIVFRIPTSLALFSLLAVLRFMKLIQASISTKMPTIPNSHTYLMFPPLLTPFLNSLYRFQRLIGCRNTFHL